MTEASTQPTSRLMRSRWAPVQAPQTHDPVTPPQAHRPFARSRGVHAPWSPTTIAAQGSSPLARGLQHLRARLELRREIIPARAGFTPTAPGPRPEPGDHPRSRGVYPRPSQERRSSTGSSPLARGLRRRRRWVWWCGGIIPARAGFTPTPLECDRWCVGSSPLARGLRDAVPAPAAANRIIPARAGFTRRSGSPTSLTGDHPRSRGVYGGRRSAAFEVDGSSPLARGLHEWADRGQPVRGIIPARAGFTTCRRPGSRSRPDHPRSRGVYAAVVPVGQATPGIIPARAGFTRRSGSPTSLTGDHPRSRGVYGGRRSAAFEVDGSSPLARGLHEWADRGQPVRGIIPARAGFTTCRRPGSRSRPDHPRSRGVYVSAFPPATAFRGSSPLARGLRDRPVMTGHEGGIIPARAGFTPGPVGQRHLRGDHPRSRGVYSSTGSSRFPSAGSSPLARGLRQAHTRRLPRERIIPARAGFTPPGVSSRTSPRDHPRSRGVYSRSVRHSLVLSGSSPLARGLLLGT